MALATLPHRWTPPAATGPAGVENLVRVDVSRLELGLFVAELDRPWMDTPFLIQGFLVDSAIELTTLQRYCSHVYVDPAKSTPLAAAALREQATDEPDSLAEPGTASAPAPSRAQAAAGAPVQPADANPRPMPADADAPDALAARPSREAGERSGNTLSPDTTTRAATPARSYRIRADVRITRETRARFRKLVRGERGAPPEAETDSLGRRLLGRLRAMVAGADGAPDTLPMIDPALEDELGALGSQSQAPQARATSQPERAKALHDARGVAESLAAALEQTMAQMRARRKVALEPIVSAVDGLVENVLDDPNALLWVMRSDDDGHAQAIRTAALIAVFGRQLRLPRRHLQALGAIGLLADVGKCMLPRALLEKPGMLNPAEYGIVKEHVRLGLEGLGRDNALDPLVAAGIAQHHERLDGSGYPKGLGRSEIGLHGRMAAIVDSFSALCAPRAYANALAPQDALMNLFQWSRSSFDAALVEQFVRAIGVFPAGSLVELSTGEIASVLAQDPARRLCPRVIAITHPNRRPRELPVEVPIGRDTGDSSAVPARVVRGLPAGAHGLLDWATHPDDTQEDPGGARDG